MFYCLVVSVLVVSVAVVSTGTEVESTIVLSVEFDTFLVELHAEAAIINEPAKARLKIVFFISIVLIQVPNNSKHYNV